VARKRSITEPPPMDEVDSAWDLDDHRPQAAEADPASSPPGAAEMAGDGGGADDNLDAD
jgi:hypothetical protein